MEESKYYEFLYSYAKLYKPVNGPCVMLFLLLVTLVQSVLLLLSFTVLVVFIDFFFPPLAIH